MNKKLLSGLVIALTAAFLVVGCGSTKPQQANTPNAPAEKKKIIVKYSLAAPPIVGTPMYDSALQMKEKLEKYSNGQIEVKVFPGAQLGSESKNVPDVQQGVIEMAIVDVGNMSQFAPAIGVFDFPYLFKNREEAYKVVDALWDELNQRQIKESNTRTIAHLEQGFRHLTNSKKPVTTMEDLKGLKIRVPGNKVIIATFKSWGIEPVGLAWDETFSAVQQKVVDGQENPYTTIYQSKMYEVQKYVTELHYKLSQQVVIVSEKWYQSQPADIKEAIDKAGKEVTQFNRKQMAQIEGEFKTKLQEKGLVMLGAPKDEEKWMANAMAIWPSLYSALPDQTMLDKALKVLGREKPKG